MERFDESLERKIDPVLDAEYISMLGSLGLYDASSDKYQSTEHPEDDKWIVRGEE